VHSTSHGYVVRVKTFSQHLSLIKLNAWEDEFSVVIKALQEGLKERKKEEKNKIKSVYGH
jgi:hypothetical protein